MTISTFFPRKSDSLTILPWRSGREKSGACADSKKRVQGHRDFAEAPDLVVGVDRERLLELPRQLGDVEPALVGAGDEHLAVTVLAERDAQFLEADPFGLQLEVVDAREIARHDPEIVRVGERLLDFDDAVVVEDRDRRRERGAGQARECHGRGESRRRSAVVHDPPSRLLNPRPAGIIPPAGRAPRVDVSFCRILGTGGCLVGQSRLFRSILKGRRVRQRCSSRCRE